MIDGSPGIGCPVIASISGVSTVLIVAEPPLSGISDMERILKTAGAFRVKTAVCVNKADTHAAKTEEILVLCRERQIPFAGTIPFDKEVVKAINSGKSITELDCPSGRAVREVDGAAMAPLFEEALQ